MLTKKQVSQSKLCLITSRGGHLFQIYQLKPWWEKYPHFWISFPGEDTDSLIQSEKHYYAFGPESRNMLNAVKNFFLAWKILMKEKPTHLISCGAGIAPPFFYVGKMLGIKLIFIEPYDFIEFPSLSAKLVEPIADCLLVQHQKQLRFFKKAQFRGSTL